MLTSFGIAEKDPELPEDRSLFYRMPPVSMQHTVSNFFMPDYAALILCEKVLLDESSFRSLEEKPHRSFTRIADAIKQLYNEGFIKLVDFRVILKRNENLLQKMLEHDLNMLDQWVEPLRASLNIWRPFVHRSCELIRDHNESLHSEAFHPQIRRDLMRDDSLLQISPMIHQSLYQTSAYETYLMDEALVSSKKRKLSVYREALRPVIRSYLSYVNANIVLSNEIGAGFHDWADFLPFYRLKFLSVGKEDIEGECKINEAQKLFEVTFPEFEITDTRTLIKVLQDKRIADLRELVENAVKGEVTFDQEFARSVLKEVFGIERLTNRYRRIISYVTMPIGFAPWVGSAAQKVIEEAVGTALERKLKQKYRWFYLLSDLVEDKTVRIKRKYP